MRKFLDKKDDSWPIELTLGAVMRVKTLSGGRFDLLKPERPIPSDEFPEPVPLQTLLMLDFPSLWEVLYMLVEPTANERKISATEFAELMTPERLVAARNVFREEWRDFFRNLQRPDQALALEKIGNWLAAAEAKILTAMENPMLADLDAKVLTQMDTSLKTSFGNLAASLDSTRDRFPGVNST